MEDKTERKKGLTPVFLSFIGSQSGSNQGDAETTTLNYLLISQQTGAATESCISCMLLFSLSIH